ncbi:MAG: STT3 domain-containing protein [Candidatus Nanohalobium sp.]
MNPAEKLQEYEDSLDAETVKKGLKKHWHVPALLGIVLLAFILRYMPANGMKYLQAVDPFMIYRMSQHIALEGNLPQLDFARYFPYATPTYVMNQGDYLIPALLYNAGFGVFFNQYLEWAQFYPAMLGALSVGTMYFLGKELFNKKTGLSAAFFLAVTAGALRRTSAGFFEKEPIGTFLMMLSLVFFTRAWKQESWKNGILSGISLGLFTISWGGADMLWLLYPIVTGATVFINEDIRSLIAAYTPTVLIGGLFATVVNYNRFSLTANLFLGALGVLGFIWVRYLVEELNILDESQLKYFSPTIALLGGIAAILSPLYSDFIAGKVIGILNKALQSGGGVIGKTVAENAPPAAEDLVRSTASGLLANFGSGAEFIGMMVSSWTFMVFSVGFITTSVILMLGRKYGIFSETISGKKYTAYLQSAMTGTFFLVSGLIAYGRPERVYPGAGLYATLTFVLAPVLIAVLMAVSYLLDDESAFNIVSLVMGAVPIALGIFVINFSSGFFSNVALLVFWPSVLAAAGTVIVYYFGGFPEYSIEFNWYMVLPLVWIVSNVFGGTTRSRLVFLATFSMALGAGYTFSRVMDGIKRLELGEIEFTHPENLRKALAATLVFLVVAMNFGSGLIMAQSLGSSPSPSPQVWEPSMSFMRNTPEGSSMLSWWDYGYYFETLGRRPAVADGGNFGYYSGQDPKINYPLADYLNSTATNPQDIDFLQKHSVDYIWLDYSMIGKFAAVSQIANKNNSQYQVIRRMGTSGTVRKSLSSDGNQTLVHFRGRFGRGIADIYTPVESTNTSMDISGAPIVRFSNGATRKIDCVLTDGGKQTYNTSGIGFCLAEDPLYSLERGISAQSQARAVLVPKKIADSTFVRLYIQDGWGVPYAEKVPEASNGYIKMWKVDINQTER